MAALRSHRFDLCVAVGLVAALAIVLGLGTEAAVAQTSPSGQSTDAVTTTGGQRRTVAVEVAKVTTQDVVETVSFSGSLAPVRQVNLASPTGELVADIMFKGGETVKKGTPLVQLDDRVAKAQLSEAQAALDQEQADNKRQQELLKRGTVSTESAEQAATKLAVAVAIQHTAQVKLDILTVTAPFDGRIGFRQMEVGSFAAQGSTLAYLYDDSSLLLEFQVPQGMLTRMKVGDKVTCESDAIPDGACVGAIDVFDPIVDGSTRSVNVRATIANPDDKLRGGIGVRVNVTIGTRKDAMVIPDSALIPTLLGDKVFRIQNNVAQAVDVKVGVESGGTAEILSGLSAGDEVVTLGQFLLEDGTPVTIKSPES